MLTPIAILSSYISIDHTIPHSLHHNYKEAFLFVRELFLSRGVGTNLLFTTRKYCKAPLSPPLTLADFSEHQFFISVYCLARNLCFS